MNNAKIFTAAVIIFSASFAFSQETVMEVETIEKDDKSSLVLSVAGLVNNTVDRVEAGREEDDPAYGGGLLLEANMGDHFGLETGILYLRRQYDVDRGDVRVVTEVDRLHIPIALRFWFTDFVSIAAGPYAEVAVGSEETVVEIGGAPIGSINTSADEDVELGFDVAATLNLAVADKTGLFIEGRYSSPFDVEADEEINELTALLGLKIDL